MIDKAQHWSGRKAFLLDKMKTLWGGFVVECKGKKLFFSGDTGYYSHFRRIREHFGIMDVSLLGIGAYEPRWFMKDQHMNPAEAVEVYFERK